MGRPGLERLSREELIELVLRRQHLAKTSRTSSKPPSTAPKERRDASRPGGGKPGHEGHSRILSEAFDRAIDHRPDTCTGCCAALTADLAAETVSRAAYAWYQHLRYHRRYPGRMRHARPGVGNYGGFVIPSELIQLFNRLGEFFVNVRTVNSRLLERG